MTTAEKAAVDKSIKVIKILEAALEDIANGAATPAPLARRTLAHARKVAKT